jgi:hypothetical protein
MVVAGHRSPIQHGGFEPRRWGEDRVAGTRVVEAGMCDVGQVCGEEAAGTDRVGGVVVVRAGSVARPVPYLDREVGTRASAGGPPGPRRATSSHQEYGHAVISKIRRFRDDGPGGACRDVSDRPRPRVCPPPPLRPTGVPEGSGRGAGFQAFETSLRSPSRGGPRGGRLTRVDPCPGLTLVIPPSVNAAGRDQAAGVIGGRADRYS